MALRIADLDAAIDFYATVVGLRLLDRTRGTAVLGAGAPILELHAEPDAPDRHPEATGLYHAAFRVPSRAALGDALTRIRGNWRLDGASDHGVSEALYCTDPEGNGVEIYRDRPQNEWPIGANGRVRMDSQRLDLDSLAADAAGDSRVPDGTDLGHVHLEVSDLVAARAFYVDALGLRVRQEVPGSALFLAAGDYHHHVGLNTWNGRTRPLEGRGLAWFEIVLPDVASLEAAKGRLGDEGYGGTDVEDGSDGTAETTAPTDFQVTDPDGITIRLCTTA